MLKLDEQKPKLKSFSRLLKRDYICNVKIRINKEQLRLSYK